MGGFLSFDAPFHVSNREGVLVGVSGHNDLKFPLAYSLKSATILGTLFYGLYSSLASTTHARGQMVSAVLSIGCGL